METDCAADSDQKPESAATIAKSASPAAAMSVARFGSAKGQRPQAISPSTMPAGSAVLAEINSAAPGAMPPAPKKTPHRARTTAGAASSTAAVGLRRGSGRTP